MKGHMKMAMDANAVTGVRKPPRNEREQRADRNRLPYAGSPAVNLPRRHGTVSGRARRRTAALIRRKHDAPRKLQSTAARAHARGRELTEVLDEAGGMAGPSAGRRA